MLLCRSPRSGPAAPAAAASSRSGAARPGAGGAAGSSLPRVEQPATADPVADVLDWLGRYDLRGDEDEDESAWTLAMQDDVCDEVPRDEGTAASARRPVVGGGNGSTVGAEQPQQGQGVVAAVATGALGCPPRGPGRLLRPTRQRPPPAGSSPAPAPDPPATPTSDSAPACARGRRPPPPPPQALGDLTCVRHPGACCSGTAEEKSRSDYFFEEEEEEWDQRQRKSGTVGRLVVYHEGESPREDVVLRGGGSRRHIVVAGVREGGQAARVGVRAGDRLVSINGKKDFLGLSADAVRDQLDAPTILVFLGFVGKLQAEVRLTCADHVCGISTRQEVVRGSDDAPVRLCEERVFNAGIASLFLAVGAFDVSNEEGSDGQGCNGVGGAGAGAASRAHASRLPLFELQRAEAHGLVRRALRRLEVKELLAKAAVARPIPGGSPPTPLGPAAPSPAVAQAAGPTAAAAVGAAPRPQQPGEREASAQISRELFSDECGPDSPSAAYAAARKAALVEGDTEMERQETTPREGGTSDSELLFHASA